MAVKKCLKTHKLFLAELERFNRLEREGGQVLSSLANVSQRLPLLLNANNNASSQSPSAVASSTTTDNVMGILSHCVNTQSLLLQRHFASLEKSMGFLRDILKELPDVLRRMKTFASEYMDLLDFLDLSDNVEFLNQQLEWMENVLRMHEHEALRKKLLVSDVEYHDAARIARIHAHWSAKSVHSNVDHEYVQAGLETLPVIPTPAMTLVATSEATGDANTKSKSQKKKKSKK